MVSPLNAKLARDLWRMKGQVAAIVAVIAVGVLLQVMMSGLVVSLTETRRAYYERNRLAQVFAPVTRAPEAVLARLAALPGVAQVEGQITGGVLFDMPGEPVPIQGRIATLPDRDGFNRLYLTSGRLPDPARRDEAVVLAGFARAHGIGPGDRVSVTLNGTRMHLHVAGLAQSPELLFVAAPGEMVPDPARFGALWVARPLLAAAFDMRGAFNEALFALSRDANQAAVIGAVDQLLERWGGTGAFGRADLVSDRFVSEEISGLATMSRAVPPLFLAVAAFLLFIVVNRMVQSEREEIGLLKAFGYTGAEIGGHYFRMVLLIAVAGAALGCVLGIVSGRAMAPLYTTFYNFPFLVFRPDPSAFAIGVLASVAAASAGSLVVLRRIFALTPAAAMRPPTPADYSRTMTFRGVMDRWLDQPSRMVIRNIARAPWRALALVSGIAAGMALAAGMTTIYGSFDRMMALSFSVIDRSDATVVFHQPQGRAAVHALARLPGVISVEPFRDVPVVLRHGLYTHRGSLSGLVENPELTRALDADLRPIPLPGRGVVLSAPLAEILRAQPGDILTAEIREGARPIVELPVAGVARSLIGAPAYMRLEALNTLMGQPDHLSGVRLSVDSAQADRLYRQLKDRPGVAAVSVADNARASLQKLMDQGAGSARYIMGVVAFVITFGIVYNAARIANSERARDLASLRVMGFSRSEAGFVLLGELGVIVLAAVPLGSLCGYWLTFAIARGFSSELYQIPASFDPFSHGFAAAFVLGAAIVSGVLVKRDLDRTDLVAALKTRD